MEESKKNTLSVIIPNYNKGIFLSQCIQSVLNQTLCPDEIIVVDDGSTDTSVQIISAFCQQYSVIKPIYLKSNLGVSHARNTGLKSARSEYVTFLDSDDFYGNENKLKNEMKLINKYRDRDIIAYSKLQFASSEGAVLPQMEKADKYYLCGDIWEKMLLGNFEMLAIARDYCVKKSIVEELGGYNEARNLYEDLELLIKLAEKHAFYCTFEYGTTYRQVSNGLSKRNKIEHQRVREEIFHENIQHLDETYRKKLSCRWKWVKFQKFFENMIYEIYCMLMHIKEWLGKVL